jgi:LmbE family N-acetylglucosaminyl deacetylase
MPHPDDMEFLCAGTLMCLGDLGYEIHVATMTPGDKGSVSLTREEIAAVRRAEAASGAAAIGAVSYRCIEAADLEIVFDNDLRRRVTHALREVNPALVITTPPSDYMADHEITSRLVQDACFNAAVKNYDTGFADTPTGGIPYLYYSDTIGGHDLFGNTAPTSCIIDITSKFNRKAEALACHASQREWLRSQHGIDEYIDAMQRWSALRGQSIGVAYAEGFRQHVGHPHPEDDILSKLLAPTI